MYRNTTQRLNPTSIRGIGARCSPIRPFLRRSFSSSHSIFIGLDRVCVYGTRQILPNSKHIDSV
jgi:hypothetical protein